MPVDVFAGEDNTVQLDEGLGVDARTSVAPVYCKVSAWLTGDPASYLASRDRYVVFREQFAVALDPGLCDVLATKKTDVLKFKYRRIFRNSALFLDGRE